MSLKGKVALVTGATRGLGKAIAIELGQQGATVIGTATTAERADIVSQNLKQANIDGKGLALDVRDDVAITETVKAISDEFGAPLILVNNAGITQDNLFLRMKQQQWDDVIDTDLTSVFRITKACIRAMVKARFGRVINITSVVGVAGNPGQANYCAAKAGMIGFTKSIAQELSSRGITANCVAPGYIATDMTNALDDNQKQAILNMIPMQQIGEPVDIAKTVSFLASDDAKYITGQTIHVNGGMCMV